MTEFSEISDVNNSLNNSCLSCNDNNESSTNYISTIDKLNMKNYTIRCSNCSSIALLNADFKKNHFITICDNQHKNEYNKFTQFINETNKDLHLILCNECKKTNEEKNLFRCNQCYLFFCDKCKINHVEKSEHQNFIEFSKIDIVCPKHNQAYKYYNNEKKIHLCEACFNNLNNKKKIIKIENINIEKINEEYYKVSQNAKICKNIQKILTDWLNDLTNKVKNYIETINNYCIIQESIINFLKVDENKLFYNNFNLLMNYESFKKNTNFDIYIQQINNKINNFYSINNNFEKMTNNFVQLLNDFNENYFTINSQKIKDDTLNETKKILEDEEVKANVPNLKDKKKFPKLQTMKKLKIELACESNCFSSLNNEENILIGLKSGHIEVYQFLEDESFKLNLTIKEFQKEIKFICEIDTNIFAATDGKTCIKIIELNNDMNNYQLIQTLELKEDSDTIYTMINLPILSYYKKRHYLCTGDERHILIWESNKQPKQLKHPENEENEKFNNAQPSFDLEEDDKNQQLSFTLIKTITLKSKIRCLIEMNEKYLAAACNVNKSINFFNVQNFEKVSEIKEVRCSGGSKILSILPKKNILVVACTDGFCLIHTKKLRKVKEVHCRYSVTSLECLTKKSLICCCSEKNENKIKQYKIDEFSYEFKKSSEKNVHNVEIWNLKTICNKIFFTNNDKKVNFLM